MSFSGLPSELIYAISYRVPPDSLEAYGCTCHGIRDIAAPLIKEHRELLADYTRANLNKANATRMLSAICVRPWIRLYPKALEVMAGDRRRTIDSPRTLKHKASTRPSSVQKQEMEISDIRDLVEGTGLIEPHDVNTWVEQIGMGDEDHLFALLIALCPNLRTLRINLAREKLEQVKEIIRRVRKECGGQSRALQNLRDIYVFEKDGSSSSSCDLELFPLAAALPGLERIHGRNLVGTYRECYRDGWVEYPGASPSITHISLETCGMSVEGLETLIQSLRNLQSFKYIAHRANWGLRAVADLFRSCRDSLHTLEISTGSGSAQYVGSLRSFAVLKHLTLDTDMLKTGGRMQRAVDILPSSIERVTLCGNNLTEPQEQAFLADLYRPAFTYPCLKSIGVEDSFGRRSIGQDRLKFQKEFRRQSTSNSWMLRYR